MKDNLLEKSINKAYAYIFLFFTSSFIFLCLSFFFLETTYINYAYWGNFNNFNIIYEWLIKCYHINFWGAFIPYFFSIAKVFNYKIRFFSFFHLLFIILIVIFPYRVLINFMPLLFGVTTVLYLHSLFMLMNYSRKDIISTFIIIIGTLLMGASSFFEIPSIKQTGTMFSIMLPFFWIVGTFICFIPTIVKPYYFSNKMIYWYSCNTIYIIFMFTLPIYLIISQKLIEFKILAVIFLSFFLIEEFNVINMIKKEKHIVLKEEPKISGIFTKSDKITEEEVSISKEKKICIVCKGKIAGYNFMCLKCGAFYCEKCTRTLIEMENACWVCETPFDKSLPLKLLKKEEKQDVEERNRKAKG